jgi:anti-sigma regulatory factor (Ser/Thr protein kinase)
MARSPDETARNHHANASSTLHILPDSAQIATARRFIRETLDTWNLSTQTRQIEVAASELVTNAIIHGEGGIDVTIRHLADRLRLEVVDEGFDSQPIQIRDASTTGQGGWGLHLVEGIADAWGSDRRPGHTLVWMERRLPIGNENRTPERDTDPQRRHRRS